MDRSNKRFYIDAFIKSTNLNRKLAYTGGNNHIIVTILILIVVGDGFIFS